MTYSPQADREYGSLLCWARNDIGEQLEPCIFYVFQGGMFSAHISVQSINIAQHVIYTHTHAQYACKHW